MWALLFPAFIIQAISGTWAQPSNALKNIRPSEAPRIPLFQFSMWASNFVIRRALRLVSKRGSNEVHRIRSKYP